MLAIFFVDLIYLCRNVFSAGLIENGEVPKPHQFPYCAHVIITCGKQPWLCGASVVSQRVLLTAAHCLQACVPQTTEIIIRTGHANLNKAKITKHSEFIIHEKFLNHEFHNDIGVIFVKTFLILDETVKRVAIVEEDLRETAFVTGLRVTQQSLNGNLTKPHIMYIKQKILNDIECMKLLKASTDGKICGFGRKHITTLPGDSGNPLVIRGFIQIGLVSFRRSRNGPGTIFTHIPYYFKWINRTVTKYYCL